MTEQELLQKSGAVQACGFDQAQFWIERHEELVGDPRSVGNRSRSLEENIETERRFIRIAGVLADMLDGPKSILDLGCGYGRLAGPFLERGYEYSGVDVSPTAVSQARARHPSGRFEACDLRTWQTPRTFGVVSAIYVLVHFVDDADWHDMVTRALTWVAPDGVLLLADEFSDEVVRPSPHVVQRPHSAYVELLSYYGFELDTDLRERFIARNHGGGKPYWIARRRRY